MLIPVGIIGAIAMVAIAINTLVNRDPIEPPAANQETNRDQSLISRALRQTNGETLTFDQYLLQRTPRVANDPSSAPIYDDIREVNSYPRPQCVYSEIPVESKFKTHIVRCQCYSQQGTKIFEIDHNQCIYFTRHGFAFDPTQEDTALKGTKRKTASAEAQIAPAQRFSVIPSTGSPSYPTSDNSYQGITLDGS